MCVAVAGMWELGHNVPLSEAPLWDLPLREFGVDEWHMYPVTGIQNGRVDEWDDARIMIENLRNEYTLVFVTEDADGELADFVHPERACYVFGRANWSPFLNLRDAERDLSVRLDTVAGGSRLWPHQCAVTVLWHRLHQWR